MLEPLSGFASEVVLAVDDRVEHEWIDGYRRIADRVFLVAFPGYFSPLFPWLRAKCGAEWILQLDADEVPAPGLAHEVAEAIARADVTHAWVPRRWLYPDAFSFLAQWPWRPDYSLRVFRNDPTLLSFPGLLHGLVSAVGPCRFLRSPIYHADLLQSREAREHKVDRYEEIQPGLVLDGRPFNEAFYLPELRASVRTAPVPRPDAAAVRRFLDQAGTLSERELGRLERANTAEFARHGTDLKPRESAYRARLTLLDDDLRVTAGETRTFDVDVENLSDTIWPGGLELEPQIRLAYRGADGRDGLRSGFGASVGPGERVLVPAAVHAPFQPGDWTIEFDLVHEHVRWFGVGIRATLSIGRPGDG
jgi:hypothetical protein